jgi:hypothetical protein
MDREDTKSRSAPAGGSGGGTQDKWTEEDFKQRVRERLVHTQRGLCVMGYSSFHETSNICP